LFQFSAHHPKPLSQTVSFRAASAPIASRTLYLHVYSVLRCLQSVRGLSIIAFIDDLTPTTIDNFTADLHKSFATGLRVSVHDRGSSPSMRTGVTVNPGTETTVWVAQTRVERLPRPWEGCSSAESTSHSSDHRFDEMTLSADACIEVCAQNQVQFHIYNVSPSALNLREFSQNIRIDVGAPCLVSVYTLNRKHSKSFSVTFGIKNSSEDEIANVNFTTTSYMHYKIQ